MNDRIKQLTIGTLTVIFTLCILWHTGNPVNWLSARVKASDYLQQNYGKSYSFTCRYMQLSKVKGYKCTIKSTDFPNGVLHICILDNGEIIG